MPIYSYRCTSCGFEDDVMQKMDAAPLHECPACKTATFAKQLTAPGGFMLKGGGWYATDFKNGAKPKQDDAPAATPPCQGGSGTCPACPAASGG